MINWDGKDKDILSLIKYIAEEDKLQKVLENPQVIKNTGGQKRKAVYLRLSAGCVEKMGIDR